MKFSWKSILLAPLAVPLIVAVLFAVSVAQPLSAFLFFFIIGSVISYGVSIFVLLPCLFVVSRFARLTAWLTGLVGMVLGGVLYFPFTWVSYKSSGPDSGPPEGTYLEYLLRQEFGWEMWFLPAAGLVTATVYWFLASRSFQKKEQPAV